jgi:hypothetical protein
MDRRKCSTIVPAYNVVDRRGEKWGGGAVYLGVGAIRSLLLLHGCRALHRRTVGRYRARCEN